MSDNPLDRIPEYDRISLAAVLVEHGEDPAHALANAGIFDPVAIPVMIGEDQPDIGFGDGITPNLTAVLEHGEEQDALSSLQLVSGTQVPEPSEFRPSKRVTSSLPAAFGKRPLAPVRR